MVPKRPATASRNPRPTPPKTRIKIKNNIGRTPRKIKKVLNPLDIFLYLMLINNVKYITSPPNKFEHPPTFGAL